MEWSDDHFADDILEHNIEVWNAQLLEEWKMLKPPQNPGCAKICVWDVNEQRYVPIRFSSAMPSYTNELLLKQDEEVVYVKKNKPNTTLPNQLTKLRDKTPTNTTQQQNYLLPFPTNPPYAQQNQWLPWNIPKTK